MTFKDHLNAWLNGEARLLKDHKALCLRAKHVKKYVNGTLAQAPEQAAAMTKVFVRKGLKPSTINRRLSIVRRVLNIAFDSGAVDVQYGRRVKLLPEKNERHVYLSKGEIEALAQAAGDCGDAIRFLAYTGLRLGEMYSLNECDILDGMITLKPENTKTSRPRRIPLPLAVQSLAEPWRWPGLSTLRRRFAEARVAVGKPDLHIHDLRHTYASLLCASGAPMTAVRDLLGHTSLAVTNRYSHLMGEQLKEAVAQI